MQINCKQKKIAFKRILMTYQILAMTMGMKTYMLKMEQGYLIAVTIAMQILILVAIQVQQIVQHQTSK